MWLDLSRIVRPPSLKPGSGYIVNTLRRWFLSEMITETSVTFICGIQRILRVRSSYADETSGTKNQY